MQAVSRGPFAVITGLALNFLKQVFRIELTVGQRLFVHSAEPCIQLRVYRVVQVIVRHRRKKDDQH